MMQLVRRLSLLVCVGLVVEDLTLGSGLNELIAGSHLLLSTAHLCTLEELLGFLMVLLLLLLILPIVLLHSHCTALGERERPRFALRGFHGLVAAILGLSSSVLVLKVLHCLVHRL